MVTYGDKHHLVFIPNISSDGSMVTVPSSDYVNYKFKIK